MESFKTWLKTNEVATSTANIAGFARPVMGVVRRKWLGPWGEEDDFFKKKYKGHTGGSNDWKTKGGEG